MSTYANGGALSPSRLPVRLLCALAVLLAMPVFALAVEPKAAVPTEPPPVVTAAKQPAAPRRPGEMTTEFQTKAEQMPLVQIVVAASQAPKASDCILRNRAGELIPIFFKFAVTPLSEGSPKTWLVEAENPKGKTELKIPGLKYGEYSCEVLFVLEGEAILHTLRITVHADGITVMCFLALGELMAIFAAIFIHLKSRAGIENQIRNLYYQIGATKDIAHSFKIFIERKIEDADSKLITKEYTLASQLAAEASSIIEKWKLEPNSWKRILDSLDYQRAAIKKLAPELPIADPLQTEIEFQISEAPQSGNAAEFRTKTIALNDLIDKFWQMEAAHRKMKNLSEKQSYSHEFEKVQHKVVEADAACRSKDGTSIKSQIDRLIEILNKTIVELESLPLPKSMSKNASSQPVAPHGNPHPEVTNVEYPKRSWWLGLYNYALLLSPKLAAHAVVLFLVYQKFYIQNPVFGSMEDYLYLTFSPLFVEAAGVNAWQLPSNFRDALRSFSSGSQSQTQHPIVTSSAASGPPAERS